MECPECEWGHGMVYRPVYRTVVRRGVWERLAGYLRGLGPLAHERTGSVMVCSGCGTQYVVTADGVRRVMPVTEKRAMREEVEREVREALDGERDVARVFPWRRK